MTLCNVCTKVDYNIVHTGPAFRLQSHCGSLYNDMYFNIKHTSGIAVMIIMILLLCFMGIITNPFM